MKKNISKKLAKRKKNIKKYTIRKNYSNQPKLIMNGSNFHYDIDGRHQGIAYGGIQPGSRERVPGRPKLTN